jgi:DNA-binding MarR family transcriptional regulator
LRNTFHGKLFANESMETTPRQCASELLEVVPLMMRVIRARVRSKTGPELSMPQFRALAFLGRNEGAMLGDVANFLSLTLPSASKMIDGLVSAGFARRETGRPDRRKVALTLTAVGQKKYGAALKASEDFLVERVEGLSANQREHLVTTMRLLHAIFSDEPPETRNGSQKHKRASLRMQPIAP